MIHNITEDELKKCTKDSLIKYIKGLLEEIDYISNCNQDLIHVADKYKELIDDKDLFHNHYVLYARNTNIIQNLETQIHMKGVSK